MFTIDFTKPWLYKDIIYFNQGNLSTNNTLRCKLVTGGSDDFTGGSIACTFTTKDSVEINGFGKLVDAKNGIIDIVFPSNSLVVGNNKLEVLVNRADGGVAQSPSISYDIWQGLTTGNGVEAETNYPILVELINSVNEVSNKANATLDRVNAMQTDITDAIDNAYRSANNADIATSNANAKIEEVETAKNEMISKTDKKIADVDRAISAGTKDLEVKEARKDASGVVHDTLEQRLKSDLIVGDKSLKDFVIDMNGMKETQDLSYETNTGYKVCNDTQNGVVKDLKISGRSLVNLFKTTSITENGLNGLYAFNIPSNRLLTVGKTMSIKNNTSRKIVAEIYSVDTVKWVRNVLVTANSTTSFTTNNNEYVHVLGVSVADGWAINDADKIILKNNCIIVDEQNKDYIPSSYFEGIASVGNGNEIEVLSRKEDGNLFKGGMVEKMLASATGQYVPGNNDYISSEDYTLIADTKQSYSIKFTDTKVGARLDAVFFYDSNFNYLGYITATTTFNIPYANTRYIKFRLLRPASKIYIEEIKDIYVCVFGKLNTFIPLKEDKKPILFKDTDGQWKPVTELRGIDENNCDVIDTTINKYINKIGNLIINGDSINAEQNGLVTPGFINLKIFIPNYLKKCGLNTIISDKYKCNIGKDELVEGIYNTDAYGGYGAIILRLSNSKASTLEQARQYLNANNFEVEFINEEIKTYEINPIFPSSYDNETMILFGSGVIAPYASWKITSSLPSFLSNIEDRVSRLEKDMYKVNLANFSVALNTLDTKLRLDRLEAPKQ